jgi:hypothetical protein
MKSLFTLLAVCCITFASAQKTEPKAKDAKACCQGKKECSTAEKKECKDKKSCDTKGKACEGKHKEKATRKEKKKAA